MKTFLFMLLFFTSLTARGEIRHWEFRVFELQYAGGEWVALEALKDGRRLRYALEASG